MDSTTQDQVDPVLLAWKNLERAIYKLTGTLEYEWDDEFRAEIEELNEAHIRYKVAKIRRDRSINT